MNANCPLHCRRSSGALSSHRFENCFRIARAVVHHGGIGTTAQALATGTPQLILPLGFDQKDNAVRVKRLGAGDWLSHRRRDGASIAKAWRHY